MKAHLEKFIYTRNCKWSGIDKKYNQYAQLPCHKVHSSLWNGKCNLYRARERGNNDCKPSKNLAFDVRKFRKLFEGRKITFDSGDNL